MTRNVFRLFVLTLLFLGAAAAHADEYFTVILTNGTSFQTRYRPVPAEWDENVVMINSDRGNWIGLYRDEVADVTSHAETIGFGYKADATTLFVGWSPTDELPEDEGGEGQQAQDLEEMFPEPEPANVLQQFVDVPPAGQTIGNQAVDF